MPDFRSPVRSPMGTQGRGLKRWISETVPGWLLLGVAILFFVGAVQSGSLAAGVRRFQTSLDDLMPTVEKLVGTFSLLVLVVGVILYHFAWHDKLQGHGKRLMLAAFIGMGVFGLGISLIPHLPDLTRNFGNVSYEAIREALSGSVQALGPGNPSPSPVAAPR